MLVHNNHYFSDKGAMCAVAILVMITEMKVQN